MIRIFRRRRSLQTNVPQHQRSPTRRGRLRCGGHSTAGSILDQARRSSGASFDRTLYRETFGGCPRERHSADDPFIPMSASLAGRVAARPACAHRWARLLAVLCAAYGRATGSRCSRLSCIQRGKLDCEQPDYLTSESRFWPSAAFTGRGEAGNCSTVACWPSHIRVSSTVSPSGNSSAS
jgi:hypothetical protein